VQVFVCYLGEEWCYNRTGHLVFSLQLYMYIHRRATVIYKKHILLIITFLKPFVYMYMYSLV